MPATVSRLFCWGLCAGSTLAAIVVLLAPSGACRARGETTASTPTPGGDVQHTMTDARTPGSYRALTPEEEAVIVGKGTERPFSGEYDRLFAAGIYTCKRCGAMLYRSQDKFPSRCGWPSFDDALPNAVKRVPDPDGVRTEIVCAHCDAHLGHVFEGEHLTAKDTRYCVNSISMLFVPEAEIKYGQAYFAGGCFWGIQYYFSQQPGVLKTTAGYMGGRTERPTYEQVCANTTGHAETVAVLYDPVRVSFETLARLFFEIHDPTQLNRQGPDVGSNYRSALFYTDEQQKQIAEKLIADLTGRGMKVVTELAPAGVFWPAEEYHQNWYANKTGAPPCHLRRKLW